MDKYYKLYKCTSEETYDVCHALLYIVNFTQSAATTSHSIEGLTSCTSALIPDHMQL